MAGNSIPDNFDDNITVGASAVSTTTAGSYNVTYNVSDAAGNTATEVIRTVNVTTVATNNSNGSANGSGSSDRGGGSQGPLSGAANVICFVVHITMPRQRQKQMKIILL